MDSLPFLVRLIATTILAKQNKALIAEVAYLRTENGYLREQIPTDQSLRFTDAWRKRLARAATGVGWKRLAEIATVAMANTIRGSHRLMIAGTAVLAGLLALESGNSRHGYLRSTPVSGEFGVLAKRH